MNWQDIHYFLTLVRTGSLSAAARELGVDHATVGRRVASLENDLKLRLVHRLPRSASLTREGAFIAEQAEEMAKGADKIRIRARSLSARPAATVRISAPPAVASQLIAPHVAAFHHENPGITLSLSGVPQNVALDKGEADIAVRMSRPDEPDLVIRRIGAMRFALYGTPFVAALAPEDWTFIGYDEKLDHVTQQNWLKTLLAGRPVVFRAGDLHSQQQAARAALGAVVLPCFMGDADSALVRLPIAVPSPARDIWLVTYPDLRRSPPVSAVMRFLASVIGKGCPSVNPE